ncbi:TfoX/Sxy family DNA transformation protein [Clostridiaceae bacterium M8S5]|nr:TfoX/Sxy family DNA transformation protein [Clostridiaceae bacterium M8S5]
MNKLRDLPNIGKTLEENMLKVGVNSPSELKKLGSKKVFKMITSANGGIG